MVTEQVDQEKQTIDVRVVKEAKTKASQMLKDNQQWLLLQQRRSEQRRKPLGWLLSVLKYHTWTWAFIIWWGAMPANLESVPVATRWVVERSNAWAERCKSLVKNFERTLDNARAKLNLCFIRLMLKRLTAA